MRKARGKEYAEIFDFITLPRPVEESQILSTYEQQYEQGLVKREFARMQEFNSLVLDAPFSAFDRESATIACQKLPDLTEQIIIFSKDMEGMLIKEQLHDKIGKYYTMKAATLDGNAKDVLETNIKEADINDANI